MTAPADFFSVAEKVVVVTGGLGQLGRQFTRSLLTRGANVVVLDKVVAEKAVEAHYEGEAANDHLLYVECDVTKRASLESALQRAIEHYGLPHGLINNAALDSPPVSITAG